MKVRLNKEELKYSTNLKILKRIARDLFRGLEDACDDAEGHPVFGVHKLIGGEVRELLDDVITLKSRLEKLEKELPPYE